MNLRAVLFATTLSLASPLAAALVLPSFEQVRTSHQSSDALLLDRNGQALADLRLNRQARRLDWVPLTELSPAMREALIAAEDRRFFSHGGIDWLAFGAAAWQNLWSAGKRGASTLTMQLAGLLDPELRLPSGRGERRSLTQKWDQSRAAIELETRWTKAQILEAYLNLAPFRGDLQGIGAASELLFGMPARRLTIREASLLAALLRGPNAKPAIVTRRACQLLQALKRPEPCDEIGLLAENRLDRPRNLARYAHAPHLARMLLKQPGQRVTTTLDAGLQEILRAQLALHGGGRASALLLDNASAEVLAWIGSGDTSATDGVLRAYPLADWWWPTAVAEGLEQRQLTAASPLRLPIFDAHDARGQRSWISLRHALATHQATLPAAIQPFIDPTAWTERLRALGLEPGSTAFAAPNLLQLGAAWRALANGGLWQPLRWQPGPPDTPRRLWRTDSAFILQDMLDGPGGAWRPHWSSLSSDGAHTVVAGNDHRYTLVLAAPAREAERLWNQLAIVLGDARMPAPPEGVSSSLVRFDPPDEPPRREWFLNGTALELVSVLPDGRAGVIHTPAQAATIILPDNGHLHMILRGAGSVALRWWMDGLFIGNGEQLTWLATPGSHRLMLTDSEGRELDRVDFEVRAAETHTDP